MFWRDVYVEDDGGFAAWSGRGAFRAPWRTHVRFVTIPSEFVWKVVGRRGAADP